MNSLSESWLRNVSSRYRLYHETSSFALRNGLFLLILLLNFCSSTRAVNMSGETAKFVKEAINKDSVVIFSKTYCPYCKMAKEVFDKLHHAFTAIELDQRDDGDSIQEVLGEITGAKTVPRVFVNGAFVGGGSDVKSLYEAGKLEKMLVTAAN